ncbi:hypothetical protein OCT51_11130 [Halomonas sp. LR3S48]|uniref:hypothetical protein n=1 Tax=Halomonas sp. LR3S48 TaxID=2982694 RepID=UPI0021E4EFF3|nr:hypothetical protein [Halomonas sp. LR3S48]UYG01766.1 hypothetical protein OCT51_11130 [Halomonas sp. LR3S48]
MHDAFFLAFTFLFLTISPAAILLCLGLSVLIGDYRFATPVGAVIQIALALGVGDYAPSAGIVGVAAASGALLASAGVLARKRLLEPRRKKRDEAEG